MTSDVPGTESTDAVSADAIATDDVASEPVGTTTDAAAEPVGTTTDAAAEPVGTTTEREVTVRRVPKYPRFLILGAGLGAVVTFILTASFPTDPDVGFGPLLGYFLIYGIPAGAVLGALVALILDRMASRRAQQVTAAHTTVDPLPEPEPDQDQEHDPEQQQ